MSYSYQNMFGLKTGLFSLCSGIWDEEKQEYRKADITKTVQCCLEQCTRPVSFCKTYCNETYGPKTKTDQPALMHRCLQVCEDQQNQCVDTCRMNKDYWNDHPYERCGRGYNCWQSNGRPNHKCIHRNANKILRCCYENCIPTRDIDCQTYCDISHTASTDPGKIGIPKKTFLQQSIPPYKLHNYPIWQYVIVGSLAGMILAVIVSIIIQKIQELL